VLLLLLLLLLELLLLILLLLLGPSSAVEDVVLVLVVLEVEAPIPYPTKTVFIDPIELSNTVVVCESTATHARPVNNNNAPAMIDPNDEDLSPPGGVPLCFWYRLPLDDDGELSPLRKVIVVRLSSSSLKLLNGERPSSNISVDP